MLRINNYFNEIYLHIYLENAHFQEEVLKKDFDKNIIDFVLDFNEEHYQDKSMSRKLRGVFPYNERLLIKEQTLDEDHRATVRELSMFEDYKFKLFYNNNRENYDKIMFISLNPFNLTVERLPELEIPICPLLKVVNNEYIQLSINFPDVYQEINDRRTYLTNNFKSNMDFYEKTLHIDDKVSKLSGTSTLIPFLGTGFLYGKDLQEVLLTIIDRYFKYDKQSYHMRCLYSLRKGNVSKSLINKFINLDRDSYFIKSKSIPDFSNPDTKDSLWIFSPSTTLIAISDRQELESSFIYSRVIEEFVSRLYILNYSTLNNTDMSNIELLIERKKDLIKLSEQRLFYKNSANILKDILDYLFLDIYKIDSLIDLTTKKIELELAINESKKNDINSQLQNILGILSLLLSTSPIYEFIVKPIIILILDGINMFLSSFNKSIFKYKEYDDLISVIGFVLTLVFVYYVLTNIFPNFKLINYKSNKK